MANLYSPSQLGITAPAGGFSQGGWYSGRQYWAGTLSDPGVIHPQSNQQGAGQAVSAEVNAQSAAQQGVSAQQLESYLQQQREASATVAPAQTYTPQTTQPATSGGGVEGAGISYTAPATINLQELYNNAYKEAGVAELETQFSTMQKQFTEAKAKNNDNPFLSEASRVGREAKLQKLFDERTANLLSDIAMKKADVEMQMNLATKQYDIDSDAAKTAFSQFNSLLDSGALQGASGQDIANITKATGISSTMIQAAINAQNAKNVKTETIKYDDGTNQGFAVINSQTGEIISKQVIAASEPTAAEVKASLGGGTTTEGGITPTQNRNYTAYARTVLVTVDKTYNTINGKLVETTNAGDKRISSQEYMQAVNDLMAKSGISQADAGQYVTQAMTDLGYVNWGK